jgi:hypothetical protein
VQAHLGFLDIIDLVYITNTLLHRDARWKFVYIVIEQSTIKEYPNEKALSWIFAREER